MARSDRHNCRRTVRRAVPEGERPAGSTGGLGLRGQPLWNALYEAALLKLRPVKGTQALLILTDGFDTGSTHTWRQAAVEAHRADATVYAIQ
jgi:hypothetical protein